ncbi:MAG TPA: hypothetical protein VF275_03165 [Gammaproteobacteria bacterium]
MNTDRPVTLEEVTATAEVQIRAAERIAAHAMKEAAKYRRYSEMLRKDRDRYKAMIHLREDE